MRARWVVMLVVAVCLVGTAVVVEGHCGRCGITTVSAEGPAEPVQPSPVTIVAPEGGCHAIVGDTLQVMLIASGTLDISALAILCDSLGIGMLREPPYVLQWDTSDLAPGEHVLRATAYLRSGEKVGAEPIVVTLTAPIPSRAPLESQPKAAPLLLKEGTPIALQTTKKMVSGHTKEGSLIRFKVTRDVVGPGNKVLIPYGSFARGKVTRSRRRGAFGKAGQLEFSVDSATAADGTTVPLRASEEIAGKSNKGVVVATALLLTVLTIFIHGKDVEVPEGTEFVAYVDHDVEIGAMLLTRPPEETRGQSVAKVSITSPADGRHVHRGSKLRVTVKADPAGEFVSARLLLDGEEIVEVTGKLEPLTLPTRGMQPGEHRLEVEATFANGLRARSDPVSIVVVDEE